MNVLITGASGFIGQHLCHYLGVAGHQVTAVVRFKSDLTQLSLLKPAVTFITVEDILDLKSRDLADIEAVINLVGVTHESGVPEDEFYRVNVSGAAHLLECAQLSNVTRLIHISSIKALRNQSAISLKTDDAARPSDIYGKSKSDAERALLSGISDVEVSIVRIPLVYGKGVKGNLASLIKLVESALPLPFLGVRNKRSILGISNLCDFLVLLIEKDKGISDVYHVTDGVSVALPNLVTCIAESLDKRSRLFWLPDLAVRLICLLALGRTTANKLLGDLELDIAETSRKTGWVPKYSMRECMALRRHD